MIAFSLNLKKRLVSPERWAIIIHDFAITDDIINQIVNNQLKLVTNCFVENTDTLLSLYTTSHPTLMEHLALIIPASLGGAALLAGLYYLAQKLRFSSKCPHCSERLPERAPRAGIMRYTPTKAYYCCGRRFYQLNNRKDKQARPTEVV